MRLASLLESVAAWAQSRCDVLGLAIVGSHARGEAGPDSDVDLVLLCKDPKALADDCAWVANFGEPRDTVPEDYGIVRALRVFYLDGLEVEFGLSPLEWADVPLDKGTRRVISDGMRILYDPAGQLRDAELAAAGKQGAAIYRRTDR